MTQISIQAEFLPGTDITDAGKEAAALADRVQCDVTFTFNEVRIRVKPGANPMKLREEYRQELGRPYPYVVLR